MKKLIEKITCTNFSDTKVYICGIPVIFRFGDSVECYDDGSYVLILKEQQTLGI